MPRSRAAAISGARLRTTPTRGLEDDAERVTVRQRLGQVRDDHLDANGRGPATYHGEGLGQAIGVEHNMFGGHGLVGPAHQQDGFCHRGGFVEQRRTGHR
jgi:hypothetical protein